MSKKPNGFYSASIRAKPGLTSHALLVLLSLTLGTLAPAENRWVPENEKHYQQVFRGYFGEQALEAEQKLVERQPTQFDNRFQRLARIFSKNYTRSGSLDPVYKPGSGRVFEIPALLIPAEEVPVNFLPANAAESEKLFFETIDGRRYFRFFVHPADVDHYQAEFAKYRRDPLAWFATPTSSNRSLMVIEPRSGEPGMVLKLSLHQNIAGASRSITEEQAVRAVGVTAAVAESHRRSGGKLPSGMPWYYMPETMSALPPGRKEGGYIVRLLPPNVHVPDKHVIPLFALIANPTADNQRWFERLFAASGFSSRKEFLWEKILKPSVELYETLALDHGVIPELHKQNLGIVIDRATNKIDGLYVRDMDGMQLDLPYRRHLGFAEPVLPKWNTSQDPFRTGVAQISQAFFFYYMQTMNFEQLTKATLSPEETHELMNRTGQHYFKAIYRRFGQRLNNLGDLARFWDRLHREVSTPEEFASADPLQRLGTKVAGYGRHLEMWTDLQLGRCAREWGLLK